MNSALWARTSTHRLLSAGFVVLVRSTQSCQHLGRSFEKRLRFRFADLVDVRPHVLDQLAEHVLDITGMHLRITTLYDICLHKAMHPSLTFERWIVRGAAPTKSGNIKGFAHLVISHTFGTTWVKGEKQYAR